MGMGIGDIRDLPLAGRGDFELLLQVVRYDDGSCSVAMMAGTPVVARLRLQRCQPHQPVHPIASAALAQPPQVRMHLAIAVDGVAFQPRRLDVRQQARTSMLYMESRPERQARSRHRDG